MNKFDLINKVLVSNLDARDKPLLIELIMRADHEWKCWPSIERLCKVKGIKHERNFKGCDVYLPGLVTKVKRGRSYTYHLNTSAIEEVCETEVIIKHTPKLAHTSAVEEVNTSAGAENTSAVEGANSTYNNTEDSSEAPVVPTVPPNYKYQLTGDLNYEGTETVYMIDLAGVTKTIQNRHTSATEEVLNPRRILTPGEQRAFEQQVRIYRVNDDDAAVALTMVKATAPNKNIDEAINDALRSIGVELMEEAW